MQLLLITFSKTDLIMAIFNPTKRILGMILIASSLKTWQKDYECIFQWYKYVHVVIKLDGKVVCSIWQRKRVEVVCMVDHKIGGGIQW